ncbi:MAG: hypothetical protein IT181_28480 [Acidobacteria bacterium]|nr:hypothetical protein [Acidobacteriota bacterium]
MSYALNRRRNELAIRMALGATPHNVWAMVLRGLSTPLLAGIGAGAWLSWVFAQGARAQLYKTAPADPLVLGGASLGVLLLAVVAAVHPMQRAASVSPESILRE